MAPAESLTPVPRADDAPAAWSFAGLLLTYWCNARCAFCYLDSGPDRAGHMTRDTALRLWRELDEHAAAHGQRMRVHLAGGEPFRDWVELVALIRAARDAGLSPVEKIETNAFWATDDGVTRARLELLRALGVERLVVSTDLFHQEYVPFERVLRCVAHARRIFGPGGVRVRWWDLFNAPRDPRQLTRREWETEVRAALARHPERLSGRAAAEVAPLLPLHPLSELAGVDCRRELLASRHVHIDAYGNVFPGTCAGVILGNTTEAGSVDAVWRAFAAGWHANSVLGPLITGGPRALAQRAERDGYVPNPPGYASKCHLCQCVRQFLVGRGRRPESLGPPDCYAGTRS